MPERAAWAGAGLIAALLALGPSSARAQPAPEPVPCADALSAQRRLWGAVSPPLVQPAIAPGEALRHWPTDRLGVWLVEHAGRGETALTRVSHDRLTRVRWSARCLASRDERARPAAVAPAFTDADLRELLARGSRGVLYLWSPHMPLSVDGYAELTTAARGRGLNVEALLDPASDRAFATAALAKGTLPTSALRVADSVELQFRELALHAPSALVYARGQLVGSPLRGYRTSEEYISFFSRVLGER